MLRAGSLIDSDRAAVAKADMLSVTRRVKLDEPATMGVPLMIPPERLNPAGSEPLARDHVYGGVPPVALTGCAYPAPVVPNGSEEVVMVNAGELMTMVSAAVAEAVAPSVSLTVKLEGPGAVGVPEIVLPESIKPAGSDPVATDQV